jgi:uncharacterized protein YlxW (UPF0749 family)
MPRGGRRENAGRRSTWDSGRGFSETKLIRVPTEFADQLLDLAHRFDAGESVETVTNSTEATKEVENLTEQIETLQKHINYLESQLSSSLLNEKRDRALAALNMGASAARYKDAKKVLDAFIKNLTK